MGERACSRRGKSLLKEWGKEPAQAGERACSRRGKSLPKNFPSSSPRALASLEKEYFDENPRSFTPLSILHIQTSWTELDKSQLLVFNLKSENSQDNARQKNQRNCTFMIRPVARLLGEDKTRYLVECGWMAPKDKGRRAKSGY
jgi:hypothetical protein